MLAFLICGMLPYDILTVQELLFRNLQIAKQHLTASSIPCWLLRTLSKLDLHFMGTSGISAALFHTCTALDRRLCRPTLIPTQRSTNHPLSLIASFCACLYLNGAQSQVTRIRSLWCQACIANVFALGSAAHCQNTQLPRQSCMSVMPDVTIKCRNTGVRLWHAMWTSNVWLFASGQTVTQSQEQWDLQSSPI